MPTARDIADTLESIAPIASGCPGDELGFIWGDPSTPVTGVACMWNAHTGSIRKATDAGANLLIVHERLFHHPPQQTHWYVGPTVEEQILPNVKRRELLAKHPSVVVYRSHSNWDALDVDGVPDQAVAALGLKDLKVIARQKFFKVHELPAPMTVAQLADHARRGLGFPHVRLFGHAGKTIQRFSFLIGGFGENQWHMPQAAMELGAQAILIGEMSEFIVISALELGLPVIETLHSRSEIPAIRRQAILLQQRHPDVPIQYIDSGATAF